MMKTFMEGEVFDAKDERTRLYGIGYKMKQYLWAVCLVFFLFLIAPPGWAGEEKSLSSTPIGDEKQEISFAISAMISPEKTFSYYQDFLDYLSKKFGQRVVLKQRRTYQEVNDLLELGAVDYAFICTGAYLRAEKNFKLPVAAIPIIYGKDTYQSYIIVAKESPIKTFDDLRGRIFAYTDDLSNTGALYPEYLIRKEGAIPEQFFSYFFYTHSHDKSIEAVARGIADGAAVDSLVYDSLKERNDLSVEKTRVILSSQPFGMPPVVVSPKTAKPFRERFQAILFGMDQDPEGKKILKNLKIDRFVEPSAGLYDSVREMENFLKASRKTSWLPDR